MRRLPIAVLLVACCASSLSAGCGDDEPELPPPPPGKDEGPWVVSSIPAEGSTDLYPVEVYYRTTGQRGLAERKVLSIAFNVPMNTSVTQATLHDATDTSAEPRAVGGTWSTDAKTLTLTVLQPEEGGPVLAGENAYAVDLRGFQDAEGHALDATHAGLGDGRLDFQTAPTDELLNHACGHTLADAAVAMNASAHPTGTLPRTDATHTYYEVTVPSDSGAPSGYTRLRLIPEASYLLFLDAQVSVSLNQLASGTPVVSAWEQTPPACAGIGSRVRFTTPADDADLRAHFTGASKFHAILEQSF
ncbi:Ig-like domain-containing protein [Stigmatella sp. ncwal1]|uniref:Ig-like domain-containing protein n=1 Tax=Stigmatella ashevillensis TaxID=2995309 RepID=A0ABT5DIA4_9BACT|nr:Ig-like domain-containing protein [Stigmatella ashevillena]MDC0712824.1 Ig-like domain-containing protein [Stigmatella ashevillena]